MEKESGPSSGEVLFLQLVSMFQIAAMQQLGKLIDATTQEVERDLGQAKISIDILDMIKEKTKGNLSKPEEEFLDKVLFELHMNYVDELKRPAEDAEAAGEETGEKVVDEAPESKSGADEADEGKGEEKTKSKKKEKK